MTNALIKDFKWDDEQNVIDEPAQDGRLHYGMLQLYPLQVSKSYTAGDYITIPGVTGGKYDIEQGNVDNNGNKKLGGWTNGGNRRLFVMVGTKQTKEGDSFQEVKTYKNQTDGDDPHLWRDWVFPALRKLSKEERDKVLKGTPAKWEDIPTGIKGILEDRDTGKEKEFEYKAWGNFHLFANVEEMKKASEKHFAQFNNDDLPSFVYPDNWGDSIQDMLDWVKAELGKPDAKLEAIAKLASLTPEHTKDYSKILADILGVPEPTIKL